MQSCCLSLVVCLLLHAGQIPADPTQKAALNLVAWKTASAPEESCVLPEFPLEAEAWRFSEENLQGQGGKDQGGSGTASKANEVEPSEESEFTFFRHPDHTRYWISGQENTIYQMHGNFHSPYQGTNSFTAPFQYKASVVGTLMLGYQLNTNPRYETEVFYDEESAGGRGLSQAFGLAGFTNLDVVRNPNLGLVPYLARAEIHQTIGFTSETTPQERGPFSLATSVPVRRIEFRAGKLGLPDILDQNAVLSDSHQQFMDWTVDNNGAWDYAADTRGYTYGADFEYQDRNWGARYVLALMPTVANGITLDWALRRARAQNGELEIRKGFLPGRDGSIRFLAYGNNAHMGDYREAVIHYLEGITRRPEITSVEQFGVLKYGFGINLEQNITGNLRIAGRFGWNEGQHESFAYTEDDQTFLFGADYAGSAWHRKQDKVGIAFNTNAIKKDHQNYLKYGGLGFLLGDGRLNYAREDILEAYYNVHAWRGLYYAIGNTFIAHPGYNQDRGPVDVQTVRMHLEF
ncbi:MAG: carbohydrate porin [Acidobacteriaceae bacterium]